MMKENILSLMFLSGVKPFSLSDKDEEKRVIYASKYNDYVDDEDDELTDDDDYYNDDEDEDENPFDKEPSDKEIIDDDLPFGNPEDDLADDDGDITYN